MKTVKIIILIISFGAILLNSSTCTSQESLYLGQNPPGLEPKIFAPGIISTDAFEFAITITKNGDEIFFTRRPTYDDGCNTIMHAFFVNNQWTKPKKAPFSKNGYIELEPFCVPDDYIVYFHSEREHPVTGKKMTNDEKIWYSVKENGKWSEAIFQEGKLNEGWVMGIAPANNNVLYLCGEVDSLEGILRYSKNNDISKEFSGIHPYIAPDESYIIYDKIGSNWEETFLCIRFKENNGKWGDEILLPQSINKTKTECFGRMSPDSKYFFFNRIVEGNGDIYWVDSKIINSLKNKNL